MNVAHKSIDLTNDKRNYNKTAGYMQAEIDELEKMIESGFEGMSVIDFFPSEFFVKNKILNLFR